MAMRKAQFVIEFIIFVSIAIIFAIMYVAVANDLLFERSEEQRIVALNDIGYNIQDEMVLAASVTDGYVRTVTLPSSADRFPYNITGNNNSITLTSGSTIIVYDLPEYSGAFHVGKNNISKNKIIMVQ